MVTRLLLSALLAVSVLIPASIAPSITSAANCQFILGFKTIHDALPDAVGDCKVDEHHNPENGDGLQETTGVSNKGGLLVWRKADNWTAYTDGYRTWVNGPNGLQTRLNTERFPFESDDREPATATPAPSPATKKARPIGSACPDGYPVKGNQGSRSTTDWIYHVPGDNSYSVTVPEECFVTAADAEAAGYRPARR